MFSKRNQAEKTIVLKTPEDIKRIKEANQIIARIFEELAVMNLEGMSTLEVDAFVDKRIRDFKARPSFKTVPGYDYATCISVNDRVVHGIPSKEEIIKDGDLVSIDVGTVKNGYIGDSCYTFEVGNVSKQNHRLVNVTYESLKRGIDAALPGNRLGDIGFAIQSYVEANGFNVVRDFTGHGVGFAVHEPPAVLHYGRQGHGRRLLEGMVIAIEPMVNVGTWEVEILEDDWTTVTCDGSYSAQFEHSIAITKDGPVILSAYDEKKVGKK